MSTFDTKRLQILLLNTGLQNKDNPLFQVLKQIIDALTGINNELNDISSGIGPQGIQGIQGIQGPPGASLINEENDSDSITFIIKS